MAFFYDLMMRPGEGFGNILSFVDAIFCRLAISNGDILGFFKIPNFDDDISSVLETDSQTWVGHTPCTVFLLLPVVLCLHCMEGGGTYLYCIEDRNLYLLGILFPIVWTPGVLSMGTVASEVVVRLFHTDFNIF